MQILLVEDDQSLAKGLCKALKLEGFTANHVINGAQALHVLSTDQPDIVILDLGLPDIDGLDLLRKIRRKTPSPPVLILTARATLDERVLGLDLGADDYLAKPFEIPELVARLRVIERRLGKAVTNTLEVRGATLDIATRNVSYEGNPIEIPRREYAVLKALMENVGRVQTREQLESKLYAWGEEVASNAIEVHIHGLRKKFDKDFIKTIRGVGYTIRQS